ncbi:MAG: sarcosine oxidase subunit gamma [Ectothiorhodospiraceae bacterium]|nr:sarcosine oxidase subunit gamma [Chromatiales bacterium]MCP5155499.1 sarcosine oxidase subunit gamma [Ectothiorhodospiraceae bacterium]
MAEQHGRQSALAGLGLDAQARISTRGAGEAGVRLGERPWRAQLALRGDPESEAFLTGVESVLGVAPPTAPLTVSSRRGVACLWLGPDEWLVTLPDRREPRAIARLEERLAGLHFAVNDVSHARTVLGLAGPRAREVLMKGCALDLHPRSFGPGRCAQSSLARCHVLLHQLDAEPAYDLYVHRSFAEYAWRWLCDAAAEHGLAIVAD